MDYYPPHPTDRPNIRCVPPDQAWTVFQAWAMQQMPLSRGTVLVLVDPRKIISPVWRNPEQR